MTRDRWFSSYLLPSLLLQGSYKAEKSCLNILHEPHILVQTMLSFGRSFLETPHSWSAHSAHRPLRSPPLLHLRRTLHMTCCCCIYCRLSCLLQGKQKCLRTGKCAKTKEKWKGRMATTMQLSISPSFTFANNFERFISFVLIFRFFSYFGQILTKMNWKTKLNLESGWNKNESFYKIFIVIQAHQQENNLFKFNQTY